MGEGARSSCSPPGSSPLSRCADLIGAKVLETLDWRRRPLTERLSVVARERNPRSLPDDKAEVDRERTSALSSVGPTTARRKPGRARSTSAKVIVTDRLRATEVLMSGESFNSAAGRKRRIGVLGISAGCTCSIRRRPPVMPERAERKSNPWIRPAPPASTSTLYNEAEMTWLSLASRSCASSSISCHSGSLSIPFAKRLLCEPVARRERAMPRATGAAWSSIDSVEPVACVPRESSSLLFSPCTLAVRHHFNFQF
mmetsp:Transcript_45210/g.104346  ORF Transcript_45210/g.104346 Transcript_45210/m.104346 type:complete len:256 (-) Transcript_45210:811-1578(-)